MHPPYLSIMTVNVLLFASYADVLGTNQFELELSPGATAEDVLRHVQAMRGAGRLPQNPLLAVNERYARRDKTLEAGDAVAIIPPVAGG
jgi:molybdopterin converting factor subunit 1